MTFAMLADDRIQNSRLKLSRGAQAVCFILDIIHQSS